jgi:hypothetical protein
MVFPHVFIPRIDPEIRVLGVEPAGAEGGDLRVEAGRHAADLALADAGQAQALHQRLHLAC